MTETDAPSHISEEDLRAIQDAKANVTYMKMVADKAHSDYRAAELAMENFVLRTYMKYGIDQKSIIDKDGRIVIPADKPMESNANS